ncbi:TRAP-type C4-dicarboxylate transport system permease small subunit [Hoeflea marina]|uniref:TRAP transporter small permease protein n=1 Tax=Hoeflea marina TaxID=274592 RepID=A0A317PHP5_9HYPH|nr:TRAP transporter small permease [Hoeflea marina]PWV98910.1 TRAP-type C4-dicarboxylate transport system permease small subunit [Hoeflea marina]
MTTDPLRHPARRILDAAYNAAGYVAAACLVALLIVIVAQMVARWSSTAFPGSSEYAGYLMASASFLGFAHALNSGSHIRVSLLLAALGRNRFWGEVWCMAVAVAATGYLAFYSVKMVYWSRKLNDISQGQDATPLWIVQIPMAAGAVLLFIAFLDNLLSLLITRRDNIGSDIVGQSHAE